jgi:hypothetical protein
MEGVIFYVDILTTLVGRLDGIRSSELIIYDFFVLNFSIK